MKLSTIEKWVLVYHSLRSAFSDKDNATDGKRRRDSTGEKACRAKLASRSRGHFKKLFYRRREHAEKLDIFASEKGKRKSLNNLSKHFKYIFYFRKTLDVVVDTLE